VLPDQGALLTGDTLLGRGTTVVAHPDGRLADYLASLQRLHRLSEQLGLTSVLPGHGRRWRIRCGSSRPTSATARSAWTRSARPSRPVPAPAPEVVAAVYADVDRVLWPAAELSVRAQLDYLGVTAG
jgi:glyoxylase-like metal-dependent hydrolase (beta-lactamase superfamily II)